MNWPNVKLGTVTVNVMLGYYVWMELRVFTVVLTGADRTATMPVYERSLYHSPDVSDEELQDHVREVALTELIDKIDDLGQTIRLLVGSGHSTEREVKPGAFLFDGRIRLILMMGM